MDSDDLTERQTEVLTFLRDFTEENGYPPTLKEIGTHLGIRNPNGTRNHLLALERKGFIEKGADRSRALRMTPKSRFLAKSIAGLKERIRRHRGVIYAVEYHLAWATRKHREHLVGEISEEVRRKIEQVVVDHAWELTRLEVLTDHVVISLRVGPDHSPERVVRNLKNATAPIRLHHPLRIKGRALWAHGFLATTDAEDRDAMLGSFLAENAGADEVHEPET